MAPPSALHFQSHQLAGLEVLAGLEPASLSLQPSFPVVAKRQACSTRPSFPAVAKRLTPSAPRIAVMSSGSVLPPVGAAASMDGTASFVFSEFTGGGLHNQTTTTHSERTAVCEIPWVFCTVRQWTRVFQITVTPADSDTISGCTTHGGPCRPARQPALART